MEITQWSTGQDELPNLLAFLGFPNPDPQKCRELAATWQHMAAPTGGSHGIPDFRRESLLPNVTGGTKRPIPSTNTEVFLVIGGVFSIRVQSVLSIVKSNPCQNRSSPHLNPYNILPYCQQLLAFEAFPPLINQPAFLPGHTRRRPPTNWLLLYFLGWQPSMGPWFENCFLKRIN